MFMFLCVAFLASLASNAAGHGMMLDPPSRSSAWRYDTTYMANYDDNSLFCGGAQVQNEENGGRCGVCGDNWAAPHPQDNENTGKYGIGKVVKTYSPGELIDVSILLTQNHVGTFNYSLCVIPDVNAPEPEDCFVDLALEDGLLNFAVEPELKEFTNKVKLPEGVTCERCVLRWTYRAGNNWGFCDDGTSGLGCGPQEHFRNCADIAILDV